MGHRPKPPLCKACGETDPDAFVWITNHQRGKTYQNKSTCRRCLNKKRMTYTLTHEEKKDQHLKGKFGITLKDYWQILAMQGGRCPGCDAPESDRPEGSRKWPVDHDHETGEVRGILCPGCNMALRKIKDNRETLKNLRRYLKEAGHA